MTGLIALCFFPCWSYAVQLESYSVDPESVTVSGFSSGGAMAMQFHIAFSQHVYGAGIFAGLPFGCASIVGETLCLKNPETVNVSSLIDQISSLESAGEIDSTFNLTNNPIFIFHGSQDSAVLPACGRQIEEMYTHFGGRIQTEYSFAAEHGFPTDFYGAACGASAVSTQYINNCNYQSAYEMLEYLYSKTGSRNTLIRPSAGVTRNLTGEVLEFEQAEFMPELSSPANVSMGSHGFVYVPNGCKNKMVACKFHIAFHGCTQSKMTIGNIYVTKTGYLEVAELNNIIVLFPQAAPEESVGNPNGCWDWWGFLSDNYLTQAGAQMAAVNNMLNRIVYS